MVAVAMPPMKTPEEVIDEHANAMRDAARRLLASNSSLRKEVFKVQKQLEDAMDKIYELEVKIHEKDQLIEEMQVVRARARTR